MCLTKNQGPAENIKQKINIICALLHNPYKHVTINFQYLVSHRQSSFAFAGVITHWTWVSCWVHAVSPLRENQDLCWYQYITFILLLTMTKARSTLIIIWFKVIMLSFFRYFTYILYKINLNRTTTLLGRKNWKC